MSMLSSSDISVGEPPLVPPDSPGSSVSTRLQEEYDELLKHAVVVPGCTSRNVGKISDSRGILSREGNIVTVRASPRSELLHDNGQGIESMRHRRDEKENEGERTPVGRVDTSGGVRQLLDFGLSPVNSVVESSGFSHRERSNAADDAGRAQPFLKTLLGDATKENFGLHDAIDRAYTATVDHDVGKMETMLDQWCLELKRNVLAEYSQAKLIIEQKCRQELMRESTRHAQEKAELIKEIDSMKEFLHTYEQTIARKDMIISNLTKAVYRQRDKVDLMKNFCTWRLHLNDVKRELFAMQLAKLHHERLLKRQVLGAWFSLIHRKWRERVQKACQSKAQLVCIQITTDYEAKIATLMEEKEAALEEIRRLHTQRDRYEETMKKAFMRGVCALNMEAMSMFHGEELPEGAPRLIDEGDGDEFYSDNLDSQVGGKGMPTSKSIPRDSAQPTVAPDPPPFRVVTSQGSRTVQNNASAHQTWAKPKSSVIPSQKPMTVKGADIGRKAMRSASPSSHAPIPSVVVERHQPVTKQTIGQATAVRLNKTISDQDGKFGKLAGQGGASKPTTIHTVRVVE